MKRMHVHVGVEDLDRSINFYSALFAARPAVVKSDYAKWMLDDPRVNFAISTRGKQPGLDYMAMDDAIAHCTRGIGVWDWASSDEGSEPDVVLASAGDVGTVATSPIPTLPPIT